MQINPNIGLSAPPAPNLSMDPRSNPKATGRDAGQAFESMFASMLLKQMRQTLNQGQGLFGHDPTDIMGGLFDHFIGQHMAQRGSLGISELIQKNIEQRSNGS